MRGFHRAIQRRLEALERLVGAAAPPETPDQTARRLELCRAALAGETPEDLTSEEGLTFSKILRYAPIARELRDEGIVGIDGQPAGGNDYHEDGDGDDQAPVWHP